MALSKAGYQTRAMAFYHVNDKKKEKMKTYFEFALIIILQTEWENGQLHG